MSPFSTTTDRGGNGTGSGFERDLGHGYGHAPSQSAPQSQSQSPGRPEERYSQQDHSMNIDTGSAGHTPVKGPVKRPRQACTNCRALKTRCLPYGGGSMKSKDTCSRCAKYGLKCDYERKPRGKAGEADEPSAGPGDMPPALWESGTDGMPRPRDGAGQHFHYGVDEMKDRFRGNDCPSGNHGQGSHRSSESYSMKGAGVISSSEPSPSTWTAPRQPDVKPHISTSSSSSATFQSGPHVTQHADSSMQTAANMSNSPTGQPPTFYDIGNRTNSLGCPAVPTHIPPPQHQPQGDPQSFHQQDPSRSISSTYISSVDSAGRPMNGPNDYTSAYRVSGAPYLQTPLSTNSSNRPSTADVRAHLPSTHPAAGGTYVRSRKTEISTLITDHLDPHLGRDDSRSPSPSRSRRYSAFDHPTTSSSSSRFQSRNSQTSKSGSARNSFVGRPTSTPTRVTVHPIDLGMLSEPEARHLFHQFFTRLADIIACFDPAYTTYERARSSPALFTAMLFASARFFRPDISPTLRSHAEVLVNRAVTEGVFDLPTIQALLVLAYWKLPKDGTAYIKLGIAIRAACQLRLWKKRAGPLPQDEEEARAVLDRERTWMALVGMDRAYSHIFEQPVMVPNSELQLTDGETWAFEHEHLNITIDWYLAWHACMHAPMDAVPMQRADNDDESRQQPASDAVSPEVYLMSSTDKWANGPYLAECHKHMAYIITIMMIMNIRSVAVQMSPSEKTVDDLICCAEDLADRLAVLSARGVLPYWSETAGTGISLSGSLLYKSRFQFNNAQIDRIVILLKRFIEICDIPFDEEEDHALHYIQRFYRRLIPVFQDLQRGNKEVEQVQQVVQPDSIVFTQQQTSVSAPWDQLMGVSSTIDPQWTMLWGFDMNTVQTQTGNGTGNANANHPGTSSYTHNGAQHSNGNGDMGLDVGMSTGLHNGGPSYVAQGHGQRVTPPPAPPFMSMTNMPTH